MKVVESVAPRSVTPSGFATLVEVGPRDGFQPIGPFIPTARKLELIRGLHAAGLHRIEATAFVSEQAVPQMADAAAIVAGMQVLVPNCRYAERALAAGASHLAFVLSVSEKHNLNNVRRTPAQSVEEYARLVALLPTSVGLRLSLSTAFDCPFDGPVAGDAVLELLSTLIPVHPDAEVALCDTTGRVTPDRVAALFRAARAAFPATQSWVFHGHDTYGLGVANVLAAFEAGVRTFDCSFAGLGGCPFAPGATGNVATEDVVWTLRRMGIETGINLDALLNVAQEGAVLPGALPGGRVREAIRAALRPCAPRQ